MLTITFTRGVQSVTQRVGIDATAGVVRLFVANNWTVAGWAVN